MDFREKLKDYIISSTPIIKVITNEEDRLVHDIVKISEEISPTRIVEKLDCAIFTREENIKKVDYMNYLNTIKNYDNTKPTIFILKDFYKYLDFILVIRTLKKLCPFLEGQKKTIIIISPTNDIPLELQEDIVVLDYPLPTYNDISLMLENYNNNLNLSHSEKDKFIKSCQGLSYKKIKKALDKIIFKYGNINIDSMSLLIDEKKLFFKNNDFLEYCTSPENISDIGGLDNLKHWLNVRSKCFSIEAQEYGLPTPKGVLLMGIQGTGKSLCAKVISHYWNMPLLRLDVGRLMGSYIGESESRTRKMISLAESMSPCILWIDEIDKAFLGMNNNGDSGTTSRVLASLITWMQEREKTVFIVATANDISKLPPELLRKGRFDEIFFVDLPLLKEREEIFYVHLQKRRDLKEKHFNCTTLAELTQGYSGAEIEQIIIDSMYEAFNENREFNQEDIIECIKRTIPLSKISSDLIDKLRSWVKDGRARNASIIS